MAPKKGLGKGLNALIPPTEEKKAPEKVSSSLVSETDKETMVNITKVEPNRAQPRKNFDEDALQELSDSIKQFGIIQPLIVQDRKDHYEIIAGERRWRAAKKAGLKEVPVIIKNYTDQEIVEISIIENIQREQLSFFEEAEGYLRLQEEFGLTQGDIAKRVCKKQSTVSNKLRLLKLPITARAIITAAGLTERHARELLRIHNKDKLFYAVFSNDNRTGTSHNFYFSFIAGE